MNFDQLFDKLEQMNQNRINYELLKTIVGKYIKSDISLSFTHKNIDLTRLLTETELASITDEYIMDDTIGRD